MHDPDVMILLFANGKLVNTDAVNGKMVYDAVEKIVAKLIQEGIADKIAKYGIRRPCNVSYSPYYHALRF